ncbi:MAG: hypothetical protein PWQ57_1884 [Desulfovibrionales bacterium]|nr:hypothetical protein [Desulfovibrionales bacterium]
MKRALLVWLTAMLACGLLAALAYAASDYDLPVSGSARATLVEGRVLLLEKSGNSELQPGGEINAPSKVRVEKGARLELALPEGSVVRFDSGAEFSLVKASADTTNRQIEVDVAMGDCWATVKDILGDAAGGAFEVNAPTAVAGVAGTVYRLRVDAAKNAMYRVYDGKIKVSNRWRPEGTGEAGPVHAVEGPKPVAGPRKVTAEEWMKIVSAGYEFHIRADGRYDAPEPFNRQQDAQNPWVKWNEQRDRSLGRP